MVPLAIGTDTGGSIRIPAAYCGLTGLKATYGRVPRHGVMGLSWTLDHAGPMTHTAADAALMMSVIAGHDPRDAYSSTRPVPDYLKLLHDAPVGRIGRLRGWFEEGVDPAVLEHLDESVSVMEDLGYEVVDIDIPDVGIAAIAAWQACYAETLSYHAAVFDQLDDRDEMGSGLLASTPFVSAADYLRALRYRTIFQRALGDAFGGCVALALAGAAGPAPLLDDLTGPGLGAWLSTAVRQHIPFNYAGVPALCLQNGAVDGMPSSMQLVGLPHSDAALLAIGHVYQGATDHHLARPARFTAGAAS
jgi:aspartyl-tRNA(Asn)/glutamyl-tRNA(Gln) amidotransferase subunit A